MVGCDSSKVSQGSRCCCMGSESLCASRKVTATVDQYRNGDNNGSVQLGVGNRQHLCDWDSDGGGFIREGWGDS